MNGHDERSEVMFFTFGSDDVGAAVDDVDVVSEMGEPEPFVFDGRRYAGLCAVSDGSIGVQISGDGLAWDVITVPNFPEGRPQSKIVECNGIYGALIFGWEHCEDQEGEFVVNFASSVDLETWSLIPLPMRDASDITLSLLAVNGSRVVLVVGVIDWEVGEHADTYILTGPVDGPLERVELPGPSDSSVDLVEFNGTFVLHTDTLYFSDDGIEWTPCATPPLLKSDEVVIAEIGGQWEPVPRSSLRVNGELIVVADALVIAVVDTDDRRGPLLLRTIDLGTSWEELEVPAKLGSFVTLLSGPAGVVARIVGGRSVKFLFSIDGLEWILLDDERLGFDPVAGHVTFVGVGHSELIAIREKWSQPPSGLMMFEAEDREATSGELAALQEWEQETSDGRSRKYIRINLGSIR